MRQLPQRILTAAAATVIAMVGMVGFTGSAAQARPITHGVTQTAFIWNCPTSVAGCSAEQTRVGDVRTVDNPITDVCKVDTVAKNLVYNRTNRGGAAKRAGFLYRSNLESPNRQLDSCTTAGVAANAPNGTIQRLCPFLACGRVGAFQTGETIKAFCTVDNDNTTFYLTVSFRTATGGPLTGGFMDRDDMNSAPLGLPDCENPF